MQLSHCEQYQLSYFFRFSVVQRFVIPWQFDDDYDDSNGGGGVGGDGADFDSAIDDDAIGFVVGCWIVLHLTRKALNDKATKVTENINLCQSYWFPHFEIPAYQYDCFSRVFFLFLVKTFAESSNHQIYALQLL